MSVKSIWHDDIEGPIRSSTLNRLLEEHPRYSVGVSVGRLWFTIPRDSMKVALEKRKRGVLNVGVQVDHDSKEIVIFEKS